MLFLVVSCLSFLLLSQSFYKPYSPSKVEPRMWSFSEAKHRFFVFLGKKRKIFIRFLQFPKRFLSARIDIVEEKDHEEEKHSISLLDLPDLALDCILEKLSPLELCRIAGVCTSLREKCTSNHLWEKLIEQNWGGVIGDAAYREWKRQIAYKRSLLLMRSMAKRSQFRFFLLEFFGINSEKFFGNNSEMKKKNDLKSSLSVMSFYLALESGKFWFPAQVFNRENGHVGFMLSCYDAWLSYDSTTDNFVARYPAQGRSMIEEGIEWNRIRAPSVDTPANVLHISDCLDKLTPDDHIEIQWRRNKEFPYGWWYGVVGHLDSCSGNQFNCQCHISDTVVLEFKQYSRGSRWRKTMISRKDHREVGNEADGFYGGIRKLCKKEEIGKWELLWPNCTLE